MTSMKSHGESPAFTLSAICRALDRRLATATRIVRSPTFTLASFTPAIPRTASKSSFSRSLPVSR